MKTRGLPAFTAASRLALGESRGGDTREIRAELLARPSPCFDRPPVSRGRRVASGPAGNASHPDRAAAAGDDRRAAQRAGATGVTRIRFSVDASGRIAGSQILQSSGPTRENRMMDKAAADALAQCPLQVGTDDMGRPVGTTTDVEYVWRLN